MQTVGHTSISTDIIGTTGAGKGVATGILLYQSILAGEGVFVMDPKDDEWAPHLYRKACEDAGKHFALIDLQKQQYQLNLIEDITPDELEELFVAGFSLAEKGQESDFYRIDDRKAARRYVFYIVTDQQKKRAIELLFDSIKYVIVNHQHIPLEARHRHVFRVYTLAELHQLELHHYA